MMTQSNPSRAAMVVIIGAAVLAGAGAASAQVPLDVLHAFSGADGNEPQASLIPATDGNFYGTTYTGGVFYNGRSYGGTVFKMTPTGTITVVHAFIGSDGANPAAPLVQANDGNFYGTTFYGGGFDVGTVFQMTPDGTVSVLHEFTGGADGSRPSAALIQATDGNLYGTTLIGGSFGDGTVFTITPDGTFSVLHSFIDAEGSEPNALIQATDGNFYGTAALGAAFGGGTAFQMTPGGSVTILHQFASADGLWPRVPLIQAIDGNFYGTATGGGPLKFGTVFMMTPAGTVTVLHAFDGVTEGWNPNALIQATDGNFYGTNQDSLVGGFTCCGTVFKMAPGGALTVVHVFAGTPTDGASPLAGLVQGTDGNLYGTTNTGGIFGGGTVFRLDTNLCSDTLTLGYSGGILDLGFTLRSSMPTTWSTWAVTSGGVVNFWSVAIPAVSPAVSFDLPIPGVPAIGPLGILTALSTAAQGVMCLDWKVVDTGGGASSAP